MLAGPLRPPRRQQPSGASIPFSASDPVTAGRRNLDRASPIGRRLPRVHFVIKQIPQGVSGQFDHALLVALHPTGLRVLRSQGINLDVMLLVQEVALQMQLREDRLLGRAEIFLPAAPEIELADPFNDHRPQRGSVGCRQEDRPADKVVKAGAGGFYRQSGRLGRGRTSGQRRDALFIRHETGRNCLREEMRAGQGGLGAGELGYFVYQQLDVAGLKAGQAGLGEYQRHDTVDIDQHRPEILPDAQLFPGIGREDDHASDRLRRGAGLAGFRQDTAQPGVILIQIGVDHLLLGRELSAQAVRYRLDQAGHVGQGQGPVAAEFCLGYGLTIRCVSPSRNPGHQLDQFGRPQEEHMLAHDRLFRPRDIEHLNAGFLIAGLYFVPEFRDRVLPAENN